MDADALFGVDELAGWRGTEEGMTEVQHVEPEAGLAAGPGTGQAGTESFAGRPGPERGFGSGGVGAEAGAGPAL